MDAVGTWKDGCENLTSLLNVRGTIKNKSICELLYRSELLHLMLEKIPDKRGVLLPTADHVLGAVVDV